MAGSVRALPAIARGLRRLAPANPMRREPDAPGTCQPVAGLAVCGDDTTPAMGDGRPMTEDADISVVSGHPSNAPG